MAQAPNATTSTSAGQMAPVQDVSAEAEAAGKAQTDRTPPAPKADPYEEAFSKWLLTLHDSPCARDTECWNFLQERLKELGTTLKGLKK